MSGTSSRIALLTLGLLGAVFCVAAAESTSAAAARATPQPLNIDLATALRLARADNLEVQLAGERVREAQASESAAVARFLPWITAGVNYRRHEGRTQAVDGTLLDVDKSNTAIGPTVTAQVDVGDAWYARLAARQNVSAADAALRSQQQDATLAAANAYFDLLRARSLVAANREAVETSETYQRQLEAGVDAGVVFKGDVLRVQTQTQRYLAAVALAQQQQRVASARLAELLYLDPAAELVPQDGELLPLSVADASTPQATQVAQALAQRTELQQSQAQLQAAESMHKGAVYGALIPSVGVQAFLGELGGGRDGNRSSYAGSRDYYLGLNWRFGPGGLFDFSRIDAARSRLHTAELGMDKTARTIERQVIEARIKLTSATEQMNASRDGAAAATETLRLTRQRKQFGVGIVLEDLQAQQELVRARSDYLNAIADYNKAQYELRRALGSL